MNTNSDQIMVVSGLPRSGTSLMMQILRKAGLPILTDNRRKADLFNPKGYFEYEKVKSLPEDTSWLNIACGKVIKIISELLEYLPDKYYYAIIFMERDLEELIDSQNKMLLARGQKIQLTNEELVVLLKRHLQAIKEVLKHKKNTEVIYINFNHLLDNPLQVIEQVKKFLQLTGEIDNSFEVIDRNLHRSKL